MSQYDLETAYPDFCNQVYPLVQQVCDTYDVSSQGYPSREVLEDLTERVFEQVEATGSSWEFEGETGRETEQYPGYPGYSGYPGYPGYPPYPPYPYLYPYPFFRPYFPIPFFPRRHYRRRYMRSLLGLMTAQELLARQGR